MGVDERQRDSLLALAALLKARDNHGWMFARPTDDEFVETDHLRAGQEGAVIFQIFPGYEVTERDTGNFIGGSKRFRVDQIIIDHELGSRIFVGKVEMGGFHISKRNFSARWFNDRAV